MAILFWLQQKGSVVGIQNTLLAAFGILFVCFIIVALLSSFLAREYHTAYKMSVMDKFVKFLDPNLQYDPFGFVSGAVYSMSDLFQRQAERYSGSDLVKGGLCEIPMEFSRVHSEYYTKRGKHHSWVTIFKGLLFVADSRQNFSGRTIVLPDFAQGLLGSLGQKLQSLMPPVGRLVNSTTLNSRKISLSIRKTKTRQKTS